MLVFWAVVMVLMIWSDFIPTQTSEEQWNKVEHDGVDEESGQ